MTPDPQLVVDALHFTLTMFDQPDLPGPLREAAKRIRAALPHAEALATRIEELEAALLDIAEERCPPGMEGDSERIRYWQQNSALAAARKKGLI